MEKRLSSAPNSLLNRPNNAALPQRRVSAASNAPIPVASEMPELRGNSTRPYSTASTAPIPVPAGSAPGFGASTPTAMPPQTTPQILPGYGKTTTSNNPFTTKPISTQAVGTQDSMPSKPTTSYQYTPYRPQSSANSGLAQWPLPPMPENHQPQSQLNRSSIQPDSTVNSLTSRSSIRPKSHAPSNSDRTSYRPTSTINPQPTVQENPAKVAATLTTEEKTQEDAHGGDAPPPYVNPADAPPPRPSKRFLTKTYFGKFRFSHAWFLFFNLAAIALSICVVSGCRTPADAKYPLVKIDGPVIAYTHGAMERDCEFCDPERVPDQYLIGLSGVCRVKNKKTDCSSRFPYLFDVPAMLLEDISNSTIDARKDPVAASDEYRAFRQYTPEIDQSTISKLGIALGSLLLASIFTGLGSMALGLTRTSGFSSTLLLPLIFDALVLLACCFIATAIIVLEVFSSKSQSLGTSVSLISIFGVGYWLLLAAFGCRLLSHPVLLVGFVTVAVCLSLLPLACLCACCLGSSSSSSSGSSSSRVVTTYNTPQTDQYEVAVADREMVYAEQKPDGTTRLLWVKSQYAMLTHL